jgi:hypothetical protein
MTDEERKKLEEAVRKANKQSGHQWGKSGFAEALRWSGALQ